MLSVRSGMGLGDSLYLQSVARHFVSKGEKVEACSAWPEVFRPLGNAVTVSPFRRTSIDRLAHYSMRRGVVGTDQFQDCCIQAGIREPVDLRLDWKPLNPIFTLGLRRDDRPIVVVQMPRAPFARTDGWGTEFLPDCGTIQRMIDRIGKKAFFVLIGKGEPWFRFSGIDLDLTNKTTISDVLDIGLAADGFLGFCSFIVPLAESLSKPLLLVWSRRGLESPNEVVRQMTPKKIIHRKSLAPWVVDDCSEGELAAACHAFLEQIRRFALV